MSQLHTPSHAGMNNIFRPGAALHDSSGVISELEAELNAEDELCSVV
jgi:hypothetical protein